MNSVIVRYGEITLKGRNRIDFEKKLLNDIRSFLRNHGLEGFSGELQRGRIYLRGLADIPDLTRVLGIHSYSPALEIERDYGLLKEKALTATANWPAGASFRVSCKRMDKNFQPDSMAVEREIGALLAAGRDLVVDLEQPDHNLQIEISGRSIFIFQEKIRAFSGFPYASAGRLVSLLSAGIDSPVATFLMMKRGVEPILLHYSISPQEEAKVEAMRQHLETFSSGRHLTLVSIPRDEIFQGRFAELYKGPLQDYLCLICKYLMHRRAGEIARQYGALGVITGDNLAQVASQTLANLAAQRSGCQLPVYSPLIGWEKEDIIALARKIGTFDLSVVKAQGCIPPSNPKTRVSPESLRRVLVRAGFLSEEN